MRIDNCYQARTKIAIPKENHWATSTVKVFSVLFVLHLIFCV